MKSPSAAGEDEIRIKVKAIPREEEPNQRFYGRWEPQGTPGRAPSGWQSQPGID